jgi:hypothetical protein
MKIWHLSFKPNLASFTWIYMNFWDIFSGIFIHWRILIFLIILELMLSTLQIFLTFRVYLSNLCDVCLQAD